MPVKTCGGLPAVQTLTEENIFVMTSERAVSQDIRPLRIAILNLMPTKVATETQLLRLIGNTPLQVETTFLCTATYQSQNTQLSYLKTFYQTFADVQSQQFDGLLVTGAPVETKEFAEVQYWEELTKILAWAETNVYASLFICWGAQAALHTYYGLEKHPLKKKLFGIFPHSVLQPKNKLVRGFDDTFFAPHSRHTTVFTEDVHAIEDLEVLSVSKEAGLYLAASKDGRKVFVTGHSEYDDLTLDNEYRRDLEAGKNPSLPRNYYPDNDSSRAPTVCWRSHANLLFSNWLNYFVYQETPFDIEKLPEKTKARQPCNF
ncbi:homoserine O-succinyltransferase [Sphaerochaeta pleomorpha str. Grapes]|uniref:Homoserine O-acetyltransferase n=1 Tax=Sphaerochaeta pleomorpha (strain ATCC BAA-1885 / DSM 22778 / Grapes) TaxID=158190 RepID=G8QSD4_SPHPG|nr:homoserine O-succinyltransferase [Sphaerochaeta pleomorpha]AEV30064.1 homoserine O-succinyltransferase [Sphaerochaeta pleomorpha str. Grapes]